MSQYKLLSMYAVCRQKDMKERIFDTFELLFGLFMSYVYIFKKINSTVKLVFIFAHPCWAFEKIGVFFCPKWGKVIRYFFMMK